MKNPCSILCKHFIMDEGKPSICMSLDANLDNESMYAWHSNCEYFQLRPGHQERMVAFEQRIDSIKFEIDADLVEATNQMWRRRFATAIFVFAMLLAALYAIINIWVVL